MPIPPDISVPELIAANEDSIAEGNIARYSGWEEATLYAGNDVVWGLTRIPEPLINNATRVRFPAEEADARLDALLAEAQVREVPIRFWLGPDTRPADLPQRLVARGFEHKQPTGMAVDLAQMQPPPDNPALRVERVHDADMLKQWCDVQAVGFEVGQVAADAFGRAIAHLGLDSPQWSMYLAYFNDEPVACSAAYQGEQVVGLHNVAALPQVRGQGAGSLVSYAPLYAAHQNGLRIGVLQASKLGHNVYRGLGFEPICIFDLMIAPTP